MARIQIQLDMGPMANALVPVSIVNADRTVQRSPVTLVIQGSNRVTSEPLAEGSYLVQASLPNGRVLQESVDLTEQDAFVELRTPYTSPRESLAAAFATRQVMRQAGLRPSSASLEVFLQLWALEAARWIPAPLTQGVDWMQQDEEHSFVARVPIGQASVPRALRIGGPKVPERFVMVPPYVDSQVAVYMRPKGLASPLQRQDATGRAKASTQDPICVSVVTHNAVAEGMLSYMLQGQFEAVRAIQDAAARQLLGGKYVDPVGATAGAYALLRSGGLREVLSWLDNLADQFEAMSDAFLILAAMALDEAMPLSRLRSLQGLRGMAVPKLEGYDQREAVAIHLLGQAYERGLPLYTEGLRLHRDVLDVLDYDPEAAKTGPRNSVARHKILGARTLRKRQDPRRWARGMDHFLEAAAQADWYARAVTVYSPHPGKILKRRSYWREPGPFAEVSP